MKSTSGVNFTLFARPKVAVAQSLAKKIALQFHQLSSTNSADKICPISQVKFAKLMSCL